jgi:hypothetical protein
MIARLATTIGYIMQWQFIQPGISLCPARLGLIVNRIGFVKLLLDTEEEARCSADVAKSASSRCLSCAHLRVIPTPTF